MNASERSLRDLDEQSRLLDLVFDAIILRDMHGVILLRNHGAEKLVVGALWAGLLLGHATLASGSLDLMALLVAGRRHPAGGHKFTFRRRQQPAARRWCAGRDQV